VRIINFRIIIIIISSARHYGNGTDKRTLSVNTRCWQCSYDQATYKHWGDL